MLWLDGFRLISEKNVVKWLNCWSAEEHIHRRVSELSGGQNNALVLHGPMLNPNIILADEPVASLDPSISREVLRHLRNIATDKNCTISVVCTKLIWPESLATIIGVEGGEIVFDLMPDILTKMFHRLQKLR